MTITATLQAPPIIYCIRTTDLILKFSQGKQHSFKSEMVLSGLIFSRVQSVLWQRFSPLHTDSEKEKWEKKVIKI